MSYLYLRLVDHLDDAHSSSSTNRQHVRVLAVDGAPRDLLGPADAFEVRVKAVIPPSEYKGVTARACVSLLYNREKLVDASQIGEAVALFVSKGYAVDHEMTRALQDVEALGASGSPIAMVLRRAA